MSYFTELEKEIHAYLDDEQCEQIALAFKVARDAHHGQKRRTGEAYITHPVAAALTLAQLRLDHQSIIATLLHDTLEDTLITKEELRDQFGDEVAELVDGVSKLTQMEFENRAHAQAENFRKMVLAMVRDIRVIIVKLADRLHNMQTLGVMPREKKRRIARETLDIYAPIANRIGIHRFYVELEDLGFAALYPMRFRILEDAVKKARGNRKEIMNVIESGIQAALEPLELESCKVLGRQKHLYSIYKKMKSKQASFSEIMDVYAFRVVVDSPDNCYRALGAVHGCYKPLPERFKDYIAIPKANGYQSLHTTLFGPYGVPIEVQIRTREMDKVAEHGIAAHWSYKMSEQDIMLNESHMRARQWIKDLLEMQQSSSSSLEFIETVKIDLFPDEVYVFTPKGHILELPRGATSVDFAYTVHSDIGNSCIAAKIDRRLAPLSMPLSNGQTVEIITAPGASPNPAWLNFVVTGRARSNIRHYLKSQRQAESVSLGKRLLNNALTQFNSGIEQLSAQVIDQITAALGVRSFDALCEAIGLGNQVALVVAKQLLNPMGDHPAVSPPGQDEENPLAIKGTEGMVVKYAECCRPIPGDPIVGCLTAGRGIVVHTDQCPRVVGFRNKPERFIYMTWQDNIEGNFKVDIGVHVLNQVGVLAQLAGAIADAAGNIDDISVNPCDGNYHIVSITLTVRNRIHLARIMRRLRTIKTVLKFYRVRAE